MLLPFSIQLFLFIIFPVAIQSSSKIADNSKVLLNEEEDAINEPPPISNQICRLPKDRGIFCNRRGNSNEIKWYFDEETLECLAFGYIGCGGNANKFNSIFECRQECHLPADYSGCSGRKPSATNAKGETIFCSGPPNQQIKCPAGFRCQNLAFYGICCNIKNEGECWNEYSLISPELYRRNYHPKCANGKQPHQIEDTLNNWPIIFLGKSCQDEFCPSASTDCIKQEIFAYCCPK